VKLFRLEIQTLPGIQPGFQLEDISPAANIVTGPNAIGKSSLVRALKYLIGGPRSGDPHALALAAEFVSGETRWTVRRTGGGIEWTVDGQPAEPPPLPEADQFYFYWLSMEDLLVADERDERVLAELRRALSGGYDLDGIRQQSRFHVGVYHGRTQGRNLDKSRRQLRDVSLEYEALYREEQRLPALRSAMEEAEVAAGLARRLEHALEALDARRERLDASAGLAAFPDNMKRIRGDELERLAELEARRAELVREQKGLEATAGAAGDRLVASGLDGGRPDESELKTMAEDLVKARSDLQRRDNEQKAWEEATAARQQAQANLGGQERLPQLDPQSISEAEAMAVTLQELEREREVLQAAIARAPEAPEPKEIERYREAADALRSWLSGGGAALPGRLRPAALLATVLVLASAGASLVVRAWLVAGIALLAAIVSGVVLWMLLRVRGDDDTAARTRFERTGLEPPTRWDRAAVDGRLRQLEAGIAEMHSREYQAREVENNRLRLDAVMEKLAVQQQQKDALAAKFGFDPALSAGGIDRMVRLVQAYEEAGRKSSAAAMAIERLDAGIAERAERVAVFLQRWQTNPLAGDHLEALEAALARLSERCRAAEQAQSELATAEREKQRMIKQIDAINADRQALFRNAGLEEKQRDELAQCCQQFPSWQKQNEIVKRAETVEAERRRRLEDDEKLLRRVEAGEESGLRSDLQSAQQKAEQLEGLREEYNDIRSRLQQAGRDGRLEEAIAEEHAARDSLEDEYHKALFADAACYLLDQVEEEFHHEHEPAVLRDARERFARFTHHAYALEVDPQRGFTAMDRLQHARRTLGELSSGTRMQLLLAVRLAWTRRIEAGRTPLPLFLDEALTTSDEQRFAEVVESLEQIVRDEGRQVFYLSARRHEIALWERAAGQRPHVIDLAEVRFGKAGLEAGQYALPEAVTLPRPDGRTPEKYAALLAVPPIDPRQPVGLIHIFHVLRDDLVLLHRLLEDFRVYTIGQLESLLASDAVELAVSDAAMRQQLAMRCSAASDWAAAWRQGRGKPVGRIALDASEIVSGTFIDQVAELAESLDGDAEALIEALRAGKVSRFREAVVDQLEEWFEAEGFIDPDTPLDADARQRHLLTTFAGRMEAEEIRMLGRWLEAGKGVKD